MKTGFAETIDDEARQKENQKGDAKALFFIQQAVDDSIFSRIAAATSSKQAWMILKTEYQGSNKVITVKLQSLRRDFETSGMKGNESVQEYLARVSAIVSQMRSYGEKITDETVVAKVLRSLAPKFDHVVAAIEESKDLSMLSFDELMGSLQAHEARINRSVVKEEEKAFQIKGETDFSYQRGRGKGRGGIRGRGRGRGRNTSLHCSYCNKYGHSDKYCWSKPEDANYVEEDEEQEDYLFMTETKTEKSTNDVWYVDSACSHHITGDKSKFKDLDESIKAHVRLGDDKQLQIEGRGSATISIGNGKKGVKGVNYAPCLAHNLLNVGQLMESGHSLLFDDGKCVIKNKGANKIVACAYMTKNRMFPIDSTTETALINKTLDESELWHLRYGHLNYKGLQLLKSKEMVANMPSIVPAKQICE